MSRSTRLAFDLNGVTVDTDAGAHESLLDVLRDRFGQRGVRESCGQGVCGTCTVTVDDVAVSSCLMLAAMADGTSVVTAEGLSDATNLHPLVRAFVDEFAFQCGFCTPGMVMMASRLLAEQPDPTVDEVRAYLGGNLCRCGCYPEIIRAVRSAAAQLRALRTSSDGSEGG